MKKYTDFSSKWLLLGMVVPILAFFFALNSAYAYFTATSAPQTSSVTTAIITMEFTDFKVATGSQTVSAGDLMYPGQTFNLTGTIKNTSGTSIYAILKWDVVVDGTVTETKYCTPSGTALTLDSATNKYTGAQEMTASGTSNFDFDYTFDFYDYDNTYQGKSVKFVFTAGGIQTAHITADVATNELVTLVNS